MSFIRFSILDRLILDDFRFQKHFDYSSCSCSRAQCDKSPLLESGTLNLVLQILVL